MNNQQPESWTNETIDAEIEQPFAGYGSIFENQFFVNTYS